MRFLDLIYKFVVKPLLFLMDAEKAHELTISVAHGLLKRKTSERLLAALYRAPENSSLRRDLAPGLSVNNPIGLAAGFDKNALLERRVSCLGFGFTEVGTVTPRPQTGNPRPRLERLSEKRAILNRMGFNNDGMEIIAQRLSAYGAHGIPLGVNIGKNKDTPNESAVADYDVLFDRFKNLASYFTVNVSSPNTVSLRELQSVAFLSVVAAAAQKRGIHQPIFAKLAPELPDDLLRDVAALCGTGRPYAGLVLTNTIMTDRGGISGAPLKERSMAALEKARKFLPAEATVISVGGIDCAEDVRTRLNAGANAVQIYSSLVYNGPGLVSRILRDLSK